MTLSSSDIYFFTKTDKEAREFIKAYPTLNSCEAVAESSPEIQSSRRRSAGGGMAHSKSRASARRMSVVELLQDKNIQQNTVKTAVFLKKLFLVSTLEPNNPMWVLAYAV